LKWPGAQKNTLCNVRREESVNVAQDPNCLFCKIVRREIPSKVAYEDDTIFAFHDIAPQAPTHILLVPKQHIATLNDLAESHEQLIGKILRVAKHLAAEAKISQSGYRCVFNCMSGAGQSVYHIHLHLLGGRPMGWPPG